MTIANRNDRTPRGILETTYDNTNVVEAAVHNEHRNSDIDASTPDGYTRPATTGLVPVARPRALATDDEQTPVVVPAETAPTAISRALRPLPGTARSVTQGVCVVSFPANAERRTYTPRVEPDSDEQSNSALPLNVYRGHDPVLTGIAEIPAEIQDIVRIERAVTRLVRPLALFVGFRSHHIPGVVQQIIDGNLNIYATYHRTGIYPLITYQLLFELQLATERLGGDDCVALIVTNTRSNTLSQLSNRMLRTFMIHNGNAERLSQRPALMEEHQQALLTARDPTVVSGVSRPAWEDGQHHAARSLEANSQRFFYLGSWTFCPSPADAWQVIDKAVMLEVERPRKVDISRSQLLNMLLGGYLVVRLNSAGQWTEFWAQDDMESGRWQIKLFYPEKGVESEEAEMEDSTEAFMRLRHLAQLHRRVHLYPPFCSTLGDVAGEVWKVAARRSARGNAGPDAFLWEW
jgi:hypothetical protein